MREILEMFLTNFKMPKTIYNTGLDIYAVYKNPSDFPGKIVVRKFLNDKPSMEPFCVEDTLDEAREKLPKGLFRMDRMPNDDIVIVETWF